MTITDVAAEGKAIAKVNDLVIFVPYVVPSWDYKDFIDAQFESLAWCNGLPDIAQLYTCLLYTSR